MLTLGMSVSGLAGGLAGIDMQSLGAAICRSETRLTAATVSQNLVHDYLPYTYEYQD
jgi:hypothetical protein